MEYGSSKDNLRKRVRYIDRKKKEISAFADSIGSRVTSK